VNIYGKGGIEKQLYSYNAFSAGSTTTYAPVIMNDYYGYTTAMVVQNMGTSTANVTITYSDAGTASDWSGTIAAGSAESFYAPDYGIPTGLLLGAKVVSDQDVAVIVNESTATNRAAAYNGFAAGSTGARAPVIMNSYYRLNSSVTCQNIGSSSATMTISYAGTGAPSGSFAPQAGNPVAVDASGMFYQPDHISTANFVGSATVTSDQPIVCVVNQNMDMAPEVTQDADYLYAYNGIVD